MNNGSDTWLSAGLLVSFDLLLMTASFNTRVKTGTFVPFYLTWLPHRFLTCTQARCTIRRIMSARLRFSTLFAHFV